MNPSMPNPSECAAARAGPGRLAVRVQRVEAAQVASLVDLLCELHAFYNDGDAVPRGVVHAHLVGRLLAAGSPHQLGIACQADGAVVGLAAVTVVYSIVDPMPDTARQCQLKELYVASAARGQGVGHALMAWVAQHARAAGCHRIDWPVKASNERGIAFYESLGAKPVRDRLAYRMEGPALHTLADSPSADVAGSVENRIP